MTRRVADFEALRKQLTMLPRGDLLTIAQRAIELVPSSKMPALLAENLRPPAADQDLPDQGQLFGEVQKFHDESMRGASWPRRESIYSVTKSIARYSVDCVTLAAWLRGRIRGWGDRDAIRAG